MFRAFNMGIGLIVACCAEPDETRVIEPLARAGEPSAVAHRRGRRRRAAPVRYVDCTVNRRLGVLISGRGSNLQAIIDAIADGRLDATIAVVISNRAGCRRACCAPATPGIEPLCLQPRDYADRDAYDRALVEVLQARDVGLVCLAGFMRLVGRAAARGVSRTASSTSTRRCCRRSRVSTRSGRRSSTACG